MTRKTIIALHGAGMHAGIWGGMAPHLIAHAFYPVSLPGHNPKTENEAACADIASMAAFAAGVLDDFAPQSCVLAGHSMGALVALGAAGHKAVSHLVLLGAAASMPVNPALLAEARATPGTATGKMLQWGIDAAHPQIDAVRTVVQSVFDTTPPALLGVDLAACDAFKDGDAQARGVAKPVLVLAGAADKMVKPAQSAALADMLPHGVFAQIDGAGHFLMVEQPIKTASEIKSFLS